MSEKKRLYTKDGDIKKKAFIYRKPGRGLRKSKDLPVENMLRLQQTLGNRGVQRLIKSGAVQAKLKIGKPNDKYEQQADHMADKVMRMTEGSLVNSQQSLGKEDRGPDRSESVANQITPLVQRQTDDEDAQAKSMVQRQEGEEEKEEPGETDAQAKIIQRQEEGQEEEQEESGETDAQAKLLQRQEEEQEEPGKTAQAKAAPGSAPKVTPKVESSIKSMKGGGQPLPDSARDFFEPRFGADFSQVRVHTGSTAAESAQAINAKAFTTGKDIVFNSGQYSPDSSQGKHLLAHELTHVLQQRTENIQRKERRIKRKGSGRPPDFSKIFQEKMKRLNGIVKEEKRLKKIADNIKGLERLTGKSISFADDLVETIERLVRSCKLDIKVRFEVEGKLKEIKEQLKIIKKDFKNFRKKVRGIYKAGVIESYFNNSRELIRQLMEVLGDFKSYCNLK